METGVSDPMSSASAGELAAKIGPAATGGLHGLHTDGIIDAIVGAEVGHGISPGKETAKGLRKKFCGNSGTDPASTVESSTQEVAPKPDNDPSTPGDELSKM